MKIASTVAVAAMLLSTPSIPMLASSAVAVDSAPDGIRVLSADGVVVLGGSETMALSPAAAQDWCKKC